jgi:hypothetical protein
MCICENVDPVACKAERYGYTVEEYQGEPCRCSCHASSNSLGQPNTGLQPDGLPAGHHGSSLECSHPFCVAEREQSAAAKA